MHCPLTDSADGRKGVAFLHLKPSEGALRAPWKFGEHEDLCIILTHSSKGESLAQAEYRKGNVLAAIGSTTNSRANVCVFQEGKM